MVCHVAAIAAVVAHLTESSGATGGIALAAFGLLYVLRAPGDLAGLSWFSWLSPVG